MPKGEAASTGKKACQREKRAGLSKNSNFELLENDELEIMQKENQTYEEK